MSSTISVPFHSIAFVRSSSSLIICSHIAYSSRSSRIRHSINCFSYLVAPGLVCSIIIPSISRRSASNSETICSTLSTSRPRDEQFVTTQCFLSVLYEFCSFCLSTEMGETSYTNRIKAQTNRNFRRTGIERE